MGKKKREHVVFDQMLVPKKSIPFPMVNKQKTKRKKEILKRKEDDWCFERYNCPRFTTPDENGNVILDYGISIEE